MGLVIFDLGSARKTQLEKVQLQECQPLPAQWGLTVRKPVLATSVTFDFAEVMLVFRKHSS